MIGHENGPGGSGGDGDLVRYFFRMKRRGRMKRINGENS